MDVFLETDTLIIELLLAASLVAIAARRLHVTRRRSYVHPPAVSTALSFAFRAGDERSLVIFAPALGVIAALAVLDRLTLWLLSRHTRRLAATKSGLRREST